MAVPTKMLTIRLGSLQDSLKKGIGGVFGKDSSKNNKKENLITNTIIN